MRPSALVLAVVTAVALCGCAPSAASEGGRLTVLAAASLRAPMEALVSAYRDVGPGVSVTVATGSSAALATQIEQGAPADLFLSADLANADRLVTDGLTDGAALTFASNRLTVVVPASNPAGIAGPADLARPGVKVIAAGAAVPITRYADRLVANLAAQPGYPVDFAARYAANVVSREDDVAAVLAKVALGEGDAGIVYATDALTTSRVRSVPVPDAANVAAAYAAVIVDGERDLRLPRAFLDWLTGPAGQRILASFGFGTAP